MAKAKQSAAANSFFKRRRKDCKWCSLLALKFLAYFVFLSWVDFRSFWNWVQEPSPGNKCNLPSRGAEFNKTKMKVLLYGPAKTGTTSTIYFLNELMERPYHSEDFFFFIWSTLADEYWGRRESGASIWPYHGLATPREPAWKGHSFWNRELWPVMNLTSDRYVRNYLIESGRLAETLEKCQVDALSFDGLESLFWDIFEMSPEAKVLFLNWRTYSEWDASSQQFGWEQPTILLTMHLLNAAQHFLPWNVLPLVLGDYLTGNVTMMLRKGMPWVRFWDPLVMLFRQMTAERRFCQHLYSGLRWLPQDESQWDAYWDFGKRSISKDRMLEVNPKTTKPAELCKFLNITNNPACDREKIPKVYSACVFEQEHLGSQLALVPWYLFIHWMSYSIFWSVALWPLRRIKGLLLLAGIDIAKLNTKLGKKPKAA